MSKSLLLALSCAILSSTALPVLAAAVQTPPRQIARGKPHAVIRPIAVTNPSNAATSSAAPAKPAPTLAAPVTTPATTPSAAPADPARLAPSASTTKPAAPPATTRLN